jgi:Tfp pilus assembly protein PilN
MPKFGKLPTMDRLTAFVVIAWIVGPVLTGWMFWNTKTQKDELTLSLEQATRDSVHYATVISASARLQSRRDTIAQKLKIIQDIDARRYVWPHILDEVSRALPEYTWIVGVTEVLAQSDSASRFPGIRIDGRTGTTLALTKFMTDLESSPFISGVNLKNTEQLLEAGKAVYSFQLEARYEEPPAGIVETVPLFKPEE